MSLARNLAMIAVTASLLGRAHATAPSAAGVHTLELDHHRGGLAATTEELAAGYREACRDGWRPACRTTQWRTDGAPDATKVAATLAPVCATGDPVACLAVGWSETAPDLAMAAFHAACELGLKRGCTEVAIAGLDAGGDPSVAATLLASACEGGDGRACGRRGALVRDGIGTARNGAEAASVASRACELGDALGCGAVGDAASANKEVARAQAAWGRACDLGLPGGCAAVGWSVRGTDAPAAHAWFNRGCALGSGSACQGRGVTLFQGEGVARDLPAAFQAFTRGCELGSPLACQEVGERLAAGDGVGKDPAAAVLAWAHACDLGRALACRRAGTGWHDGAAGAPDFAKARGAYERGCSLGDGDACNLAALLYDKGEGVAHDQAAAVTWFKKACALEHGWGCFNTAYYTESGLGTAVDLPAAADAYEAGCKAGVGRACNALGLMLEQGRGRSADLAGSFQSWERGCTHGYAWSCHNAGIRLKEGRGVTRDPAAALARGERAVTLATAEGGWTTKDLATLRNQAGMAAISAARYPDARRHLEAALVALDADPAADRALRANLRANLALATLESGDIRAALPLQEAAFEEMKQLHGVDSVQAATAALNLGVTLGRAGQPGRAEPLLRASAAVLEEAGGANQRSALQARLSLGYVLQAEGRLDEAGSVLRSALAEAELSLGRDDDITFLAMGNLAGADLAAGRYAAAEGGYRRALAGQLRLKGPDHPDTALAHQNLGAVLQRQGRAAESEQELALAVDTFRRSSGPDAVSLVRPLMNLGWARTALGNAVGALEAARDARRIAELSLGSQNPLTIEARGEFAAIAVRAGDVAEAVALAKSALADAEATMGPDAPATVAARTAWVAVAYAVGLGVEALPDADRVVAARAASGVPEDLATALAARGELLLNLGRNVEARSDFERARETLGPSANPDGPLLLEVEFALGRIPFAEGRAFDAVEMLSAALAHAERVYGPSSPDVVMIRSGLAAALAQAGRGKEAVTQSEQALRDAVATLGADARPTQAARLNHVAALRADGRSLDALPVAREAADRVRRTLGDANPLAAIAVQNLAAVLTDLGRYDEVLALVGDAEIHLRNSLGSDHPLVAAVTSNRATALIQMGRAAEGRAALEDALRIVTLNHTETTPDGLAIRQNLGAALRMEGRHDAAVQVLERAAADARLSLGLSHPVTAGALASLGETYREAGDLEPAARLLTEALAVNRAAYGGPNAVGCILLDQLAAVEADQGHREAALRRLDEAERAYRETRGETGAQRSQLLTTRGGLLRDADDAEGALGAYQAALAVLDAAGIEDGMEAAAARNNVALALADLGRTDDARAVYADGLRIADRLPAGHPTRILLHENLGAMLAAAGDIDGATVALATAEEEGERRFVDSLFMLSPAQRREAAADRMDELRVLMALARDHPSADHAALAARAVLHIKGRLVDAEAEVVALARQQDDDPEVRRRIEALRATTSQISALEILAGGAPDSPEITTLRALQADQERELAGMSAGFRVTIASPTIGDVAAALPADTVLVDIVRYSPWAPWADDGLYHEAARYGAYVLHPDGTVQVVDLRTASATDQLVEDLRATTADGGTPDTSAIAHVLSPVVPLLGSATRIVVAPDGDLTLLPWSLLRAQAVFGPGRSIVLVGSGRDLLRRPAAAGVRPGPAVVVADVDFDAATRGPATRGDPIEGLRAGLVGVTWSALPGTRSEGRGVRARLGWSARLLDGARATEATVSAITHPRVLHLATHAFFLEGTTASPPASRSAPVLQPGLGAAPRPAGESPLLLSGLVLAGANQQHAGAADDGYLTAAEAAGLDLRGTELVVLSACETGLGHGGVGDSVVGLRRSLTVAGAQTQVLSLWKVDDQATAELMRRFYRRLHQGQEVPDALAAAQDELRRVPRWSAPYYWAGFTVWGDWSPLDSAARLARDPHGPVGVESSRQRGVP